MRCLIILCSFILSKAAIAQQDFFIFIQSDNRAPFYVRIGERTYSSSATGHIILSGLSDSSYQLNIGLPKNQSPELNFQVPINKKDQGFELKNTGSEGWGLYDWRQMKFIRPAKKGGSAASADSQIRRNDSYARLMAGLVDDSAVLYTAVARTAPIQQPKPETTTNTALPGGRDVATKEQKPPVIPVAPTVTKTEETSPPPVVPAKPDSVKAVAAIPVDTTRQVMEVSGDTIKSQVALIPTLVSENKVDGGTRMIFIDKSTGSNDTVELLIPEEPTSQALVASPEAANNGTAATKEEDTKPDSTKPATDSAPENKDTAKSGSIVLINSDCRDYATEVDVDKLRVLMMKEDSGDGRITVARKTFRTKCFTTKQIKALTELFAQDEQRYRFFDTAYPFVSDTSNFKNLVELLSDPYYINRFKAMIRG